MLCFSSILPILNRRETGLYLQHVSLESLLRIEITLATLNLSENILVINVRLKLIERCSDISSLSRLECSTVLLIFYA